MRNHIEKNIDKFYPHIDCKKRYINFEDKIKDEEWVKQHGFYPFIRYTQVYNKFVYDKSKGKKIIKSKKRPIMYAAHIDRFIYHYYSRILDSLYNNKAIELEITDSVIAYRTDKPGKCNIHFSFDVFEFIGQCEKAFIYAGDFSKFFDMLDHKYLKEQLCCVLGCDKLSPAQYAIFKSMTKYSFIEMEDIELYKGKKRNEMKNYDSYFRGNEFRNFKKNNLKNNINSYGIPQGSSMSSIYSNIYMMNFDLLFVEYIKKNEGMYRRYCDDFILVIPVTEEENREHFFKEHLEFIQSVINGIPGIFLNEEKSEYFYYDNKSDSKMKNLSKGKDQLDYLGFVLDGTNIIIRERSLFKYYYRAYSKARTVKNNSRNPNQWRIKKKLYRMYTHVGKDEGRGNFISYVYKAEMVFRKSLYFNPIIRSKVKHHWTRINNRMKF